MSRPRVDESLEWHFIKMILTKNQGRGKETKSEWGSERADTLSWIGLVVAQGSLMWPSVCVESWRLLSIFLRVSQKWLLEYQQLLNSCWSIMALRSDCGLLLRTKVQLVVSCITIVAQVVFKMLLVLVTGQLVIAGQLGREVHLQSIGLFLRSRKQKWFWGDLGGWDCWRYVCLILGGCSKTRGRSFLLLPRMRLENLFLCLSYIVVFTVIFLVVVINSHYQSVYVLKQGEFFLFLGRDRILDPIGKSLVIVMAQNTISPT